METSKKSLFVPIVLIAFFSFLGLAEAKKCSFDPSAVSVETEEMSYTYQATHKPTVKINKLDRISRGEAYKIIFLAWKSFGYSNVQAAKRTNLNLKQVRVESGFQPNLKSPNIVPNSFRSGGLFQFIPQEFNKWAVKGYSNRFAPLDSALAAVNAQVNSNYIALTNGKKTKILNGKGGWSPIGGSNPCK